MCGSKSTAINYFLLPFVPHGVSPFSSENTMLCKLECQSTQKALSLFFSSQSMSQPKCTQMKSARVTLSSGAGAKNVDSGERHLYQHSPLHASHFILSLLLSASYLCLCATVDSNANVNVRCRRLGEWEWALEFTKQMQMQIQQGRSRRLVQVQWPMLVHSLCTHTHEIPVPTAVAVTVSVTLTLQVLSFPSLVFGLTNPLHTRQTIHRRGAPSCSPHPVPLRRVPVPLPPLLYFTLPVSVSVPLVGCE